MPQLCLAWWSLPETCWKREQPQLAQLLVLAQSQGFCPSLEKQQLLSCLQLESPQEGLNPAAMQLEQG